MSDGQENKKDNPRHFRSLVLRWYEKNGRHDLPWRGDFHPYHVFLSELMLQQTQVPRVIEKFRLFVSRFPGIADLADAPQSEVLRLWKGLGYNRRAIYLHRAAGEIVTNHDGAIPEEEAALTALPGVGQATARAIQAYAFNLPVVYIETNIRACLLHHFFPDREDINDEELRPVLEACLIGVEPRIWYSALMDYGTWLKKTFGNPNRRSRQHSVQSRFEGSDRQIRGRILEELLVDSACIVSLQQKLSVEESRLQRIISDLQREGFLHEISGTYHLKK
jgi:A/G-specific adenine glycosylase